MQLGKELSTGFVTDDEQATVDREADVSPDGADAQAPGAPPSPAPQPEPTTAG